MRRVLVAEDDPPLAELIRDILTRAGYEVAVVRSGRVAAALLGEREWDLAILDVLMPEISGDALAEELAFSRPQLPVLLITGDHGATFLANTGVPTLRKPFEPDELLEQAKRLTKG